MKLPQIKELPLRTTRRELLQLMGAGAAMTLLPPGCAKKSTAYKYKFLTADEIAGLDALADVILPPDQDPGGKDLGTSEYVDRLLSAFEGGGPIWAGGPFSGRAPYPAADGSPSNKYPSNDFNEALPLDRVHALYWKYLIYGSSVQPGPNDALDGPFDGYRNMIRKGLANAQSQAQAAVKTSLQGAPPEDLLALVNTMLGDMPAGSAQFINLVILFVTQASFAAPEYGGNKNLAGWKIANWEGDRQPVGYSWYDPATQTYREDPAHPVSTANPGTDPDPMDPMTESFVSLTAGIENAGS
jgi:hypothetical protein